MRKYFQITTVLVIFGLVVFLKQLKGNNETMVTLNKNNQIPTDSPTISQNQNETPVPTLTQAPTSTGGLKNGTYIGDAIDVFYGNIQVSIVIVNGRISKVDFPQYPNDGGHTTEVSQMALPVLESETIQAQNANIDIVSGATQTSGGFIKSLQSAIDKAKS
ncbi:MAG TPA: FMN-binding protein [Candidatus Sulfotelmatobacter sp.]|nr:FMN-binding protein [Candidatus Sulfotelmatobacter sp.]